MQNRETMVQIGPASTCVIQERRLALDQGSVTVRGEFTVLVRDLAVRGNSSKTHFSVSMGNGEISVRVLQAGVTLQRGSKIESVGEGETRKFSSPEPAVKAGKKRGTVVAIVLSGAGTTGGVLASHFDDGRVNCASEGDSVCAFAVGH